MREDGLYNRQRRSAQLLLYFSLISHVRAGPSFPLYNVTICTGSTSIIRCSESSRILISDSAYGWSSRLESHCSHHPTDQLKHISPSDLSRDCVGQTQCTVTSTKEYMKCKTGRCPSKYQIVYYRCIPKNNMKTMCKRFRKQAYDGAITSPEFPEMTGEDNHICTCQLESSKEFSLFLLHQLFPKSLRNICKQKIQLRDAGGQSFTWDCYSRDGSMIDNVRNVTMVFHNEMTEEAGRFWMKYFGRKKITVNCMEGRERSEQISTTKSSQSTTTSSTTTPSTTTSSTTTRNVFTTEVSDPIPHLSSHPTLTPSTSNLLELDEKEKISGVTPEPTPEDGSWPPPGYHDKKAQSPTTLAIIAMCVGFVGGIILTISIFVGVICLIKRRRNNVLKSPVVSRQDSDISHLTLDSGYHGLDPGTREVSPPTYAELTARLNVYERILSQERNNRSDFNIYDEIRSQEYDYAYAHRNRNFIGDGESIDSVPQIPAPPAPSRNREDVASETENEASDSTPHTYLSLLDNTHAYSVPTESGYLKPIDSTNRGSAVYIANHDNR